MAKQTIYLEDDLKRVNKELPEPWDGQSVIAYDGHFYVYSGSINGHPCFRKRKIVKLQ